MKKSFKETVKKYFILEAAIFAAVILIDQITKVIAKNTLYGQPSIKILGNLLQLTYVENAGASFGWLSGASAIFFIVTLIGMGFFGVLFYLSRKKHVLLRVSIALMASGALGNAIDRAFRGTGFFNGRVRDFISMFDWFICNVADVALSVGVTLFAIMFIFFDKEKKPAEVENGTKDIQNN